MCGWLVWRGGGDVWRGGGEVWRVSLGRRCVEGRGGEMCGGEGRCVEGRGRYMEQNGRNISWREGDNLIYM